MSRTLARVHLREMSHRDVSDVEAIDRDSFAKPWSDSDFSWSLGRTDRMAIVAEVAAGRYSSLAGYAVVEFLPDHLHVRRFAVHRNHRRNGVGTAMLGQVATLAGARAVTLHARETNRDACEFWAAKGFASELVRGHYGEEDGYRFARGGR